MLTNLNYYKFNKSGYSIQENIPFLWFEGDFGRVDIILSEIINFKTSLKKTGFPCKEVYLNSRRLDFVCAGLERGQLVIEYKEI